MTERCVALLGRPDRPTDAVEDYCRYLGGAMENHGVSLEPMRMNWATKGWREVLREVRKKAEEQRGCWFLVQYTALAWSRRGFALRLPELMRSLKQRGARCAVVFHDASPYGGSRLIDQWATEKNKAGGAATLCVFSVSPDSAGRDEVELIALAVRYAAQEIGSLRLVVVGRNSGEAGRQLQQKLIHAPVEVIVHGILTGDEIVRVLGTCHAMLFTRGQISSRRSSAIAGIACGLPIIAPQGSETAPPTSEAGVVLLPAGARSEFGPALVRVLTDDAYRESLAERSRRAQERYFSWSAISAQYVKSLREAEAGQLRGHQGSTGPRK